MSMIPINPAIHFEDDAVELLTYTMPLSVYRADYQDVDYFLNFCQKCRNYAQQWVCPPFDFDVNAVLDGYDTIDIYGAKYTISPVEQAKVRDMEEVITAAKTVAEQIRKVMDPQLLHLEQKTPRSQAFYAGSCYLCGKMPCTRILVPPSACRFPDKARHSLETFGFDLSRTASELLSTPMLWAKEGHLPPYYIYIGGLLH